MEGQQETDFTSLREVEGGKGGGVAGSYKLVEVYKQSEEAAVQ